MTSNNVEAELSKIYDKLNELTTGLKSQHDWPPYLKTEQACKYLSCSPGTLRKFCIEHEVFPQKKLGENYYIRADIDQIFLSKN